MSNNPRLIYRTKIATLTPTKTYRVYADHLDTSRRVTTNDNEATIVWKWEGKPFGESEATGTLSFNLRFPGQYFDSETKTHYNINRDYNPVTGRYIQSDPIGFCGGNNTYLYAVSNSLINIDTLGLVPCQTCLKGCERDIASLCRKIKNPRAKAVCWGTVYIGEIACKGMCYLHLCD